MWRAPAGSWKRWAKVPGKSAVLIAVLFLQPAARAGDGGRGLEARAGQALETGLARLEFDPHRIRALFGDAAADTAGSPGHRLAREDLAGLTRLLARTAGSFDDKGDISQLLALDPRLVPPPADLPLPGFPSGPAKAVADSLDRLLPGAGEAFRLLVEAERLLLQAFEGLTPDEFERLRALAAGFPLTQDEWPDYPIAELAGLASHLRLEFMLAAVLAADKASAAVRRAAADADWKLLRKPAELDSPWGRVVLAGPGNDRHDDNVFLLVDPGGDDTYRLSASVRPRVRMIIDLAGNDRYESSGADPPAGCLAWVEDLSGADRYRAGPFGQGCGLLGAGILVDRQGNDLYEGGLLCQGAAFYGIGCLLDVSGDDRYSLEFGGQGACFAEGIGVLADLAGDDSYYAGGRYPDYRETGATKSFAQGAAAGLRPYAQGGLGLLYDRGGTDSFEVGYFGQGAGYWGGAGLLIDAAGDDSYSARRYGQGCGLHFAAGCLADLEGNDRYTLGGVGQGAGEDRAAGILLETAGSDSYTAGWMARGAAGAGGVGLLLELAGPDLYAPAGSASDGWAGRAWELAGLGFLIDCEGVDRDDGKVIERSAVRSGTWGAAVRLPAEN
ncbi:MAG: hypothetical protein V1794_03025 [Candidatus Glassbacteria bacterium]